MQEELPWNLAEGAANPYPLAVKPRDIPSNKRDMQLIKIKYCVDTSFTKRQKRHENDVKICYCLAYSNTMKPFTPSCLLGATGTNYSSHIRNPLHSLGVSGLRAKALMNILSLHAIRSCFISSNQDGLYVMSCYLTALFQNTKMRMPHVASGRVVTCFAGRGVACSTLLSLGYF